jgi:hypothetical protein
VPATNGDSRRPRAVACSLLGGAVDAVSTVNSGRNSRVYRVEHAGRAYALKQYPRRDEDPRDRLGTEVAALGLMERHGIGRVPRVLAVDRSEGFALLTWLDGAPLARVDEKDVDTAVAFLAALHALRRSGDFAQDHLASEACLSRAEIIRQLELRRARLRTTPATETDLHAFLDGPYAHAFDETTRRSNALTEISQIDADAPLAPELRSLVPSDFGFHNTLRADDGSLVFFDFEYFGWDDPVKMTADLMLHPGTRLPAELRQRICTSAKQLYGGTDPWFGRRFAAYYPLFGLRWVLILLNDFVRNSWRRELADSTQSWQAAKDLQLAKAQQFLDRVCKENDGSLDAA